MIFFSDSSFPRNVEKKCAFSSLFFVDNMIQFCDKFNYLDNNEKSQWSKLSTVLSIAVDALYALQIPSKLKLNED